MAKKKLTGAKSRTLKPHEKAAYVVARHLIKHGDNFATPWWEWNIADLASHFEEPLFRVLRARGAKK